MKSRNNVSRITIAIRETYHKKLKAVAALLDKSMQEIVIESIKEHLSKYPNQKTLEVIENIEKGVGLEEIENIKTLLKK